MKALVAIAVLWTAVSLAQETPAVRGTPPSPAPGVAAPAVSPSGTQVAPPPVAAPPAAAAAPSAPPAASVEVDRKPILLAFDLEGKGVGKLESEAASQAVVRGLRELEVFEVMSAADVRQLLAIERTKQLLGVDSDTSNFSDLGSVFGARHAVAGTMSRVGEEMRVEIRLLDNSDRKVLGQKSLGPVTRIEQVATALPGLAQELVGPLLDAQRGELLVRTNEEAVEVLVDDVLVASTPMQTAVKLPRGQHRVQVRKDGFIAQSRGTRVYPEQVSTEEFLVIPSPDYAEAFAERHGRLRLGAWLATGAAVGLLGGGFLLDRYGSEPLYSREFLPRQLALNNVTQLPTEVESDPELLSRYSACGGNVALCQIDAKRFGDQLLLQQVATASMVVLGVASAATAGYLFITGKDPNRYANLVAGLSASPEGGSFVLSGRF